MRSPRIFVGTLVVDFVERSPMVQGHMRVEGRGSLILTSVRQVSDLPVQACAASAVDIASEPEVPATGRPEVCPT